MRQEYSQLNSTLLNGCGCLVILVILMILTAIALPSFLAMANKSKQSEGKQYVSSMNKGQQAYFAEKSAFATSIADLEIGIKTETTNYKYSTRATKTASFNYAVAKEKNLTSSVGGVFLVPAKTTSSILCEADDRGTIEPAEPTYQNGEVICGKGTTLVSK